MAEDIDGSQKRLEDRGSISLLRELQHALYEIARQAEVGGDDALHRIQLRADQSLRLIDSYIISTQVEAGQTQLELSPYGIGSIMHETAHELRAFNGSTPLVQARAAQPVMTNYDLLKSFLFSMGQFISDAANSPLVLRSFATQSGKIGVGVFAENFDVSSKELKQAIDMSGQSLMPMAQHSQRSGIMLVLAGSLARALGGELHVKRMGNFRGFATTLPKSQQMSLVAG